MCFTDCDSLTLYSKFREHKALILTSKRCFCLQVEMFHSLITKVNWNHSFCWRSKSIHSIHKFVSKFPLINYKRRYCFRSHVYVSSCTSFTLHTEEVGENNYYALSDMICYYSTITFVWLPDRELKIYQCIFFLSRHLLWRFQWSLLNMWHLSIVCVYIEIKTV